MRIVLLTRSFEIGGAETQIVALAKGLRERGHDISLACLYAVGPLLKEVHAAEIPVIELEKKGRWDVIGFVSRLGHQLSQYQPTVVQSFLGPPNVLIALAKNRLGGASVIWGIRASDMNLGNYDWSWRLTSWLERLLASRADGIVSNSNAGSKVAVARGLPIDKISVIPNGIDVDRFRPDPEAGLDLRKEWNVPDEVPLIGLVARFDPMKGHGMFLRAAARFLKERPESRFVCVGHGPQDYVDSIRVQARTIGIDDQMVWAGARRDMHAVYNAIDILALTSSYGEGFSNTLGEAMACGVPCTATDVGDAAIIIADNNMIIARDDDEGMASAWRTIFETAQPERDAQRANCRHRIETEFSVSSMVDEYLGLYRQVSGTAD